MKRSLHTDFMKLGIRIKEARMRRGLTLDAASKRAGLSSGLLSKIENFRAVPSLPVLAAIAECLEVDMGDLVGGLGGDGDSKSYLLTRADGRSRVDRDDAVGFFYESLGSRAAGQEIVEACVLTITPGSRRKAVTTDGEQFIFILDGRIDFVYGRERISMGRGDALFFDGSVPHVPKCTEGDRAVLLAIYILGNERAER